MLLQIAYPVKINDNFKRKIKANVESSRLLNVKATYDISPPPAPFSPKKEERKEEKKE